MPLHPSAILREDFELSKIGIILDNLLPFQTNWIWKFLSILFLYFMYLFIYLFYFIHLFFFFFKFCYQWYSLFSLKETAELFK